MKKLFHAILAAGLLSGSAIAQTSAQSAQWPTKAIKLVVPYPPGGGSDSVGRIFATRLSQKLGQPVVVENLSGAGGSVGAAQVSKAAPDGYTLLMGNTGPNAITPHLLKNTPYDVDKGFTPISVVTTQPLYVLVNADSPYKTLADLVQAGKRDPGKLYFSSSGMGGLSHLAGEMISSSTGAKFMHVPYKGAAPALMGVLTNEVAFHTPSAVDGVAQINGGKMRALAVTSAKRWTATPDIPTVGESGYPDLVVNFWYGLFGPANMPKNVVDRLTAATREVLQDAATKKNYEELGSVATFTTSEELHRIVLSDAARYGKIISAAGIKAE
ncbi:MAG: tripartite tricarboxylate transporter substrate binding protein [Polaromonas sp.]|nr:tripartite tricarboxylate transporter substrate binding protein [Polaromonas sp.]